MANGTEVSESTPMEVSDAVDYGRRNALEAAVVLGAKFRKVEKTGSSHDWAIFVGIVLAKAAAGIPIRKKDFERSI